MDTNANSTSVIVDKLTDAWDYLVYDSVDKRTSNWPLLSNPFPFLAIMIVWFLFVKKIGPQLMKNREPFQLKNILIVYNFLLAVISAYITYHIWSIGVRLKCFPMNWDKNHYYAPVACYLYFLTKIIELLDTVFFVMRKKDSQITFLHLYHHTIMPILSWTAVRYMPGGYALFVYKINSAVHVPMYIYYMLAAMGPKYRKYLWWKKYMTALQIMQFIIGNVFTLQVLFIPHCYPKWTILVTLPNGILFFRLFAQFYSKTYAEERKKAEDAAAAAKLKENSKSK